MVIKTYKYSIDRWKDLTEFLSNTFYTENTMNCQTLLTEYLDRPRQLQQPQNNSHLNKGKHLYSNQSHW